MAEVSAAAYQDIRDRIQSNWTYLELYDNNNAVIFRLAPSDARLTWTHAPGAQVLERQAVIKGNNADVTLPKTFAKSAIFKVATAGDALSTETFTNFTMQTVDDQLTIRHRIEVPDIP